MYLLARYKWETLPHPLYSLVLSRCDFDLLLDWKKTGGVKFEDFEEIQDAVAEQVRMYEHRCLATGIHKVPSRWKSGMNIRATTLKDFSKVCLIFQIITNLESSLHYFGWSSYFVELPWVAHLWQADRPNGWRLEKSQDEPIYCGWTPHTYEIGWMAGIAGAWNATFPISDVADKIDSVFIYAGKEIRKLEKVCSILGKMTFI